MVIGFDAKRIVRNATGLGSYSRTLVRDLSLADSSLQLRLYAPDRGRPDLWSDLNQHENVMLCLPSPHNRWPRSLWRSFAVLRDLLRDGVQLYHGLSGELPVGIRPPVRTVVTIHDLIFLRHPEYYNPIDVAIYRWKAGYACRHADRIVAISERTKLDIMEYFHVAEDRIEVVYQSCAPRFSTTQLTSRNLDDVKARYSLPGNFVLSVGTIEPRKNLLTAAKAAALLPGLHLVAVGRATPYARQVEAWAVKNDFADRLHLLHGVPDADLPALYHLAGAFVYPSRYEGFGIPIIEAISTGLPVVACTGSCLEEAGGPDSLYTAPDDIEAFADAITRSLPGADGRDERIARSRDYIRRFEGQDAARRMLSIYSELLCNAHLPH